MAGDPIRTWIKGMILLEAKILGLTRESCLVYIGHVIIGTDLQGRSPEGQVIE